MDERITFKMDAIPKMLVLHHLSCKKPISKLPWEPLPASKADSEKEKGSDKLILYGR
jgi:hypothetical protein